MKNQHYYRKNYRNFVDISKKMLIIIFRMDTQNAKLAAKCGFPADISRQNVVVGAKQLRKALAAGRARYVFLAENADPRLTEPVEELCVQSGVPYSWVASMADLGSACGIEVGAAAAAVVG